MAKKFWKIALGVGCGVVLLAIVAVAVLFLGLRWLEGAMQRRAVEPLTAIEIRECEAVRVGGSITARGSFLNGGEGAVRDVEVMLAWKDGSGSVIEQDWVYTAGEVAPGGRSEFEHVRDDPGGALGGVDCWIYCVSNDEAKICR